MTRIELNDYQIFVGDCRQPLQDFLTRQTYSQYFVLVDENTKAHCLPYLQPILKDYSCQIIEITSGEIHKNIDTCTQIWSRLIDLSADRRALVINLGGGVIGDMGGFCAGTYKRGIDFMQIPTTLLSQVDASIGGKLGIDFGQIKNSVGLFQNPQMVLVDPFFLKTLPSLEVRSGFAEIIKHSLIADQALWKELQAIENLNQVDWTDLLVTSLKIKQRVVEADPFEHHVRKTLNFGHTVGHAIESFALESANPLLHGEAVAAGMICETFLSKEVLGFSTAELEEVNTFIRRIYGSYSLKNEYFPDLIRLMKNDKKNQSGKINFTMLKSIGTAEIDQHCSEATIIESLHFYQ